ncbi:MAG: hypothetical protein ABII72_01670 [Parcubacteria group bacterium]
MLEDTLKENNIDITRIGDKETLPQLEKLYRDFLRDNTIDDAYDMVRLLPKRLAELNIKASDPDLSKKYDQVLTQFQFIALAALVDQEVLDFISNHFVEFLGNKERDIFERVRTKLMSIPIEVRDDYKKKIVASIKENREQIGDKQITIRSGGEQKPPQVKNWIANYDNFLGAGFHKGIERSRYIAQSPSCQGLNEEEKNLLHDTLYFYDLLKISSWEVGALDNWGLEIFAPFVGLESSSGQPETAAEPEATKPPIDEPAGAAKKEPVPTERPQPNVVDLKDTKDDRAVEKSAPPAPEKFSVNSVANVADLSVEYLKGLSPDPHQAAEQIKRQIIKLIGVSPLEKSQAKNNWQQSPLYRLYIAMGEASMKTKKPIREVAAECQQKNQPYLTEAEFKAVVEISRIF